MKTVRAILLVCVLAGCTTSRNWSSPVNLAASFQQAFNRGDMAKIERMFHREGCDRKSFEMMMGDFRNEIAQGCKLEKVSLEPFKGEAGDPYRKRSMKLTLTPEFVLQASYAKTPEQPGRSDPAFSSVPMGIVDGIWRLAAPR